VFTRFVSSTTTSSSSSSSSRVWKQAIFPADTPYGWPGYATGRCLSSQDGSTVANTHPRIRCTALHYFADSIPLLPPLFLSLSLPLLIAR